VTENIYKKRFLSVFIIQMILGVYNRNDFVSIYLIYQFVEKVFQAFQEEKSNRNYIVYVALS
jgi:hypothetical protein